MYKEPLTDEFIKKMNTNKSTLFLYPLLFLHNSVPDPIATYLGFKNHTVHNDMNLICLYHLQQPNMRETVKIYKNHEKFHSSFLQMDYMYFIMDFSKFPHTYNCIKNGKYSEIKNNVKNAILIQKESEFIHHVGLTPENFYENIAEEFNTDISLVKNKKEILDPPNIENEYIHVPEKILKTIK